MYKIKLFAGLLLLIGPWAIAQHGDQTVADSELAEVDSIVAVHQPASDSLARAANLVLQANHLNRFYAKLQALPKGTQKKINIVHIGDSHIQADLFSGKVRQLLQTEFGNGGLGFSFPYRLAKTNGNHWVNYNSNVEWDSYRNIYPNNGAAVGLSGIALSAKRSDFVLEIDVKDSQYHFSKMKIFTPNNEDLFEVATSSKTVKLEKRIPKKINHKIKNGEAVSTIARKYGVTLEELKKANNMKSNLIRAGRTLYIPTSVTESKPVERTEFDPLNTSEKASYHEYKTDKPIQKIYLLPKGNAANYSLNGLVFENENPGILYHSIGVNGAKLSDYSKYKLFFDQVQGLKPDLIVVSLGTNEAFDKMSTADFQHQLTLFLAEVKKRNPGVDVLVTTPPPSLFSKKHPNTYSEAYADSILEDAKKAGYAVWDLFHILGGLNSVHDNFARGLVSKDYIHYTKVGYEYKGELLTQALLDAFKNFKLSHPIN